MLSPNNWADRVHAKTKLAVESSPDRRPYKYVHSCVQSTCEKISAMEETEVDSTYEEVKKTCAGFEDFERIMGYAPGSELSMLDDPCVTFWKATYDGLPCYVVDHSRISYIWVQDRPQIANDPVNW